MNNVPKTGFRVGVDVGGTFTDLVAYDPTTSRSHTLKTPSTPDVPHRALIEGLERLGEEFGAAPARIGELLHGTTISVNTLLQRNGASVGMLVNEGFRDLLQVGRMRLPDAYDFVTERPATITPRRFVKEVRVRRLADCSVEEGLDEEHVRERARELASLGVDAVAVCFLHSYKCPDDELRAVEILREELPGVYACASSTVWPEMREYERAMVALINAYIGPATRTYYAELMAGLSTLGVECPVYSTKSNGGVMTAHSAGERPVETLLSGPASGVVAASHVATLAGFDQVVAVDMGGTSTEAAVIQGDVTTSSDSEIGDFQVVVPAVDVRSLGAGGGSVAWLDRAGVLKVGPRSAGSEPGPASYGRGGAEPTVTDAYLALGVLHPERFLGGRMRLDDTLARTALKTIGNGLGLDVEATADAIIRVATSNMYAKLVPLLAEAGLDPRDTAILAYGGAGPTHAFLLAADVGIRTVIVPRDPGTLCALGCLVADLRSDFVRTVNMRLRRECPDAADEAIVAELEQLATEARTWLADERPGNAPHELQFAADMRYAGQAFTLPISFNEATVGRGIAGELAERFENEYRRQYDVENSAAQVDLINLRSTIVARTPEPELPRTEARPEGWSVKAPGTRAVYLQGVETVCQVADRDDLTVGDAFQGPAIVEQYDTTTFIPGGFAVTVDQHLNLIGRA